MGSLGNAFPEALKAEIIERHWNPGLVLYLYCEDLGKNKYFLLASAGEGPFVFYINSTIHGFIVGQPDLLACQVRLEASDHAFLNHDSYVNCTEPVRRFTRTEIQGQLLADISRIKGELSPVALQEVIKAVQRATTIPPLYQEQIVSFLKGR